MEYRQDAPIQTFAPKGFLLRLLVGVLVLNLFVLLMAGISIYKGLRNRRDQAVATAQNLSLVLDRYVAETFSKADNAVLAVKEEAERVDMDSPGVGRTWMLSFADSKSGRRSCWPSGPPMPRAWWITGAAWGRMPASTCRIASISSASGMFPRPAW